MRPWNLGLLITLFADCGGSPSSDTTDSDGTPGREPAELMSTVDTATDSGFTGDTGFASDPPYSPHEISAITVYQYVPIMDCHDDYCVDSWIANEWALSRYHNDAPDGCPECDVTTTMQVWRRWFSCGLIDSQGRFDDILAVGLSSSTGAVYAYTPDQWIPLDEFAGSTFSEHAPGLLEWTDHTTGEHRYSYEYYGSSPCADGNDYPGYFQYIVYWH